MCAQPDPNLTRGRTLAGQVIVPAGNPDVTGRFWYPARAAREGARAQGSVPLSGCDAFADRLSSRQGALQFEVEGFLDTRGRPGLHLRVGGVLQLRCERCLEPFEFMLDCQRDIVLVEGATEFEQDMDEDDAADFIPLTAKLDLWGLAQEEAVLSMPIAPRHPEGQCRASAPSGGEGSGDERGSAFATLTKLRGRSPG